MDGRKRVGFLQSSVDRFVEQQPGAGAPRLAVQPIDRRGAGDDHRAGAAAGPRRRLPRRRHQAAGAKDRPQRRDDPLHAEAVRPRPSRGGRLSRQPRAAATGDASGRSTSSISAASRSKCWPSGSAARGPASTGSSPRCGPQRIMELPLDYIPNDVFARVRSQKAEDRVLGPLPESEMPPKKSRLPSGLPPYLASLYEVPLLTRKQEAHLFRKMNYLKYKASRLRDKLDPARPQARPDGPDRAAVRRGRGRRRTRSSAPTCGWWSRSPSGTSGPTQNFFELVSDGNMSLMRAVEKFDYARGNKFSTYASWAIMKNFARTIPDEHRHHDRFRTSHAEMFAHDRGRPDRSVRAGNGADPARGARWPRSSSASTSASRRSSSAASACGTARSR